MTISVQLSHPVSNTGLPILMSAPEKTCQRNKDGVPRRNWLCQGQTQGWGSKANWHKGLRLRGTHTFPRMLWRTPSPKPSPTSPLAPTERRNSNAQSNPPTPTQPSSYSFSWISLTSESPFTHGKGVTWQSSEVATPPELPALPTSERLTFGQLSVLSRKKLKRLPAKEERLASLDLSLKPVFATKLLFPQTSSSIHLGFRCLPVRGGWRLHWAVHFSVLPGPTITRNDSSGLEITLRAQTVNVPAFLQK